jgi:cytoskeletal protein RodZ
MPGIGDTLREARMRQQLDIADVEARTKIRAKYLRALENEEFGLLPGSTFARTFLRTYAEVLGLDPHVLVEEYRTNYEREEEMLDVQALGTPPPPRDRERRYTGGPPSRLTVVVAAVVLLLAFLLVLGLTGGEDDGDETAQTAGETEAAEKPAARKRRRPKPAPPREVSLEVTPTGPTYVCLDRGPGTEEIFEGTISATQTFKGEKLRINLGRTAVELKVNGKPFPVAQEANPVAYEFSRTGSKQLEATERPTCA